MHLMDQLDSNSISECDIVEEQQQTIKHVSVGTQTDQEVQQYSDKATMTDDIEFFQLLTHDHPYSKPALEFRPSPPPLPVACLSADEWDGFEGGSSMEEGSEDEENEFEMSDSDSSDDNECE